MPRSPVRLSGGRSSALLVVLDEAANIAPLPELDGLAATCAGHGVQLVTVWQDLAQVRARYGERAATVVNNHRAKLFLPGIADPATLELASQLAGEEELVLRSVTTGPSGERSISPFLRPCASFALLPPDALRRMAPGTGVLLYGALPPVLVWQCSRGGAIQRWQPGGGTGLVGGVGRGAWVRWVSSLGR